MPTLVDSNVILDVVTDDADWGDWSASMLARAAQEGRLIINPLIYAEVSCGYDRIETLDEALPPEYFVREPLPWPAAFWRQRPTSNTASAAGAGLPRCRISTSAPTRRSPATRS